MKAAARFPSLFSFCRIFFSFSYTYDDVIFCCSFSVPQQGQHCGEFRTSSSGILQNTVDDGLTSLSWLQNLNMCMTRLGAPTPPTPPASPNRSNNQNHCKTNQRVSSKQNRSSNMNRSQVGKEQQGDTRLGRGGGGGGVGRIKNEVKVKKEEKEDESDETGSLSIVDYRNDSNVKPPFSYASLICMAMKSSRNKMTLNSIYKWIRENFVYYQHADRSWQVSSFL